MKIVCDRKQFSDAFSSAAMCAPKSSPKPILKNVKIVATTGSSETGSSETGSSVTMSATDMETGIHIGIEGVDVQVGGEILAQANLLGSILRESTDEKLAIESNEKGTVVKGERSKFNLSSENPDEFPEVQKFTSEAYYVVPSRLFKELLKRTSFACEVESSRYALGGVLIEFEGDKIIAVATDGRRLAVMEGPCRVLGEPVIREHMTTIIPIRAVQMLQRSISDDEGYVKLDISDNDVLVQSADTTLYTRLVEGRFPRWRDVIPTRDSEKVSVQVGPLYSTLRQASIVASEESRGIDFLFSEGNLAMSGNTKEVGSSRAELPISFPDKEVMVTVDHRYVSDFLKVLDSEKIVTLDVLNNESALLMSTDDGSRYVAMPLARDAS